VILGVLVSDFVVRVAREQVIDRVSGVGAVAIGAQIAT
jgi:hypothetical protein